VKEIIWTAALCQAMHVDGLCDPSKQEQEGFGGLAPGGCGWWRPLVGAGTGANFTPKGEGPPPLAEPVQY